MTHNELRHVLLQLDNDMGRIHTQLRAVVKELDLGRGQNHKAEHHLKQLEIRAQALLSRTLTALQRMGVQPYAP